MKKIFLILLISLIFIPFMPIQAKEIIIKDGIVNGTITIDKNEAEEGEIVTIKAVPNPGYELKSLKAVDKFDEMPVVITDNSFVMPSYKVFISAEFEKIAEYVESNTSTTNNIGASKSHESIHNNNLIYVLCGLGILFIGAIIIIIIKKKK